MMPATPTPLMQAFMPPKAPPVYVEAMRRPGHGLTGPLAPLPSATPSPMPSIVAEVDPEAMLSSEIRTSRRQTAPLSLSEVPLTPLMQAVTAGVGPGPVHRLLNTGVDVNETDALGRTALMIAAEHDNVAAVYALLRAGAGVTVVDSFGETAQQKAVAGDHAWIARILTLAESEGTASVLRDEGMAFPTKAMPDALPPSPLLAAVAGPAKSPFLSSFSLKRGPQYGRSRGPQTTTKF